MTEERESANADAEPTHSEDISTTNPNNIVNENNNDNNENSTQEQLTQKEENTENSKNEEGNTENSKDEDITPPPNENLGDNNQNNISSPSQDNNQGNIEVKNASQPPLDQDPPNDAKNNDLEIQNEQSSTNIEQNTKPIENQPPVSISNLAQPTDMLNQSANVLNVFSNTPKDIDQNDANPNQTQTNENDQNDANPSQTQTNENDQNDATDKNSQSQNSNTDLPNDFGAQNAINQNQAFLRSFSTNVIPSDNVNTKNESPVFHRQISITNSNLPTSDQPNASAMKQHLSVPLMPLYATDNNNDNNTNSLLSFQYLYHQQQPNMNATPKPVIPIVSNNGLFSSANSNHKLTSAPNAASVIQTQPQKHHHHHHHHHRKHQEQEEEVQQEPDPLEQTRSPLGISPSDLQEILSREDDEPELDLTPQTSAALETFKKTGKLRFSLPDSLQAATGTAPNPSQSARVNPPNNSAESVSYSPTIIRKLQHDKVNAIIKGRYDEAKEADSLSKRVTTAVMESVEEDKRFERLQQAEWKLEDEKRTFSDVHVNCIEKVKEEEEALNQRLNALDEIHQAEMRQFEEKWNNEDFLRRFSKPSSSLLQLKAVERSMVIAKMFDEAKVVKSRAEQLEKQETRNQQNRAEQEMKVERTRLLERQKKEKQGLKEKCDNLLNIAKRNMEKEESPYKARISRLENIVAELKSGAESKCKIVPSKVQSSLVTPRGHGNELLTAKTAFKFSAYKVTSQSMKLKIKPLGSVTIKEKKKSKTTKK